MKKLYGSLFTKLLAAVIVCILAPLLIVCAYFADQAYDENMYFSETEPEFEQSSLARHFVNECLADVREFVYWNDILGLVDNRYYFENKNFAYIIYDSYGDQVVSTLTSTTGKAPKISLPEDEGSEGYILVVKSYPAEEVTTDGTELANYTMEGYLKMPMDSSESGYEEYVKFKFIAENRDNFINVGIFCFIVCAVLCLYLISASGYSSDGTFELRGFNSMDCDVMIGLYIFGVVFILEFIGGLRWGFSNDVYKYLEIAVALAAITALTLILICNISANLKVKKWWQNTLIYKCISLCMKFVSWFMASIGMTWKFAVTICAYSFGIFFLGLFSNSYYVGVMSVLLAFLLIAAGICIAIWFGVQLKKIKRGGEAIANGDFDYRINNRELWPMLRGHAYNLNSAALGMSKAVEGKMKSERFKTELITNVSHDLKTPLTSIVSYVDLLKKENIENETAKGYIEVIDRQSAKLKKLTEDLVEASKASSGTISVNKEIINIGEFINQSVGEFSEKLEAAEVTPVINRPEEDIFVCTDGRLLWRVFDNLTQNIIKYAQPGTRAYFDIFEDENSAVLTIKNISKEPLNMSADALMERFVRGDASRNSEGNGLGLSIAKSLTELCGGTFELALDGDLYKVTVTMPKTAESKE